MSLKAFTLPGKDSRCILHGGRVFKIKTLMPPSSKRDINSYLDQAILQKEVEDIVRAVLAVPSKVEPVMMRTKHLVVKTERKEWKLPSKVDFKQNGHLCRVDPYMYVLNLQLLEEGAFQEASKRRTAPSISSEQMSSKESIEIEAAESSSPELDQPKRQRRRLFRGDQPGRADMQRAPSHGSSGSNHRYALRKRAPRISSGGSGRGSRPTHQQPLSRDEAVMDGGERIDEEEEEEESSGRKMERMGRGEGDGRGRESPILESGFSRLVQRRALSIVDGDERNALNRSHTNLTSTGDQGPIPAKPSGGDASRVTIPRHPGREVVEQHVLDQQLRLQQMASPAVADPALSTTVQGARPRRAPKQTKGVVKQMIDAVVTPVKNLFYSQ